MRCDSPLFVFLVYLSFFFRLAPFLPQLSYQIDLTSMVVLRTWTGYQEAQCFFVPSDSSPTSMSGLSGFNQSASSRPLQPLDSIPARYSDSRDQATPSGKPETLHLLIYTHGRSHLMETWELPFGDRSSAFHLSHTDFQSLIPSPSRTVS